MILDLTQARDESIKVLKDTNIKILRDNGGDANAARLETMCRFTVLIDMVVIDRDLKFLVHYPAHRNGNLLTASSFT